MDRPGAAGVVVSARCSTSVCSSRPAVIVQEGSDTMRYCLLCWENYLTTKLASMDFGDASTFTVERAASPHTLPIYRVS